MDASERFLTALAGLSDPEKKRKAIGNAFIEVFDDEANQIKDVKWLAQGTIYPDVIESVSQLEDLLQPLKVIIMLEDYQIL